MWSMLVVSLVPGDTDHADHPDCTMRPEPRNVLSPLNNHNQHRTEQLCMSIICERFKYRIHCHCVSCFKFSRFSLLILCWSLIDQTNIQQQPALSLTIAISWVLHPLREIYPSFQQQNWVIECWLKNIPWFFLCWMLIVSMAGLESSLHVDRVVPCLIANGVTLIEPIPSRILGTLHTKQQTCIINPTR